MMGKAVRHPTVQRLQGQKEEWTPRTVPAELRLFLNRRFADVAERPDSR